MQIHITIIEGRDSVQSISFILRENTSYSETLEAKKRPSQANSQMSWNEVCSDLKLQTYCMASTTPALPRTTEVTDFFGENNPDVYVLFEMFVYLFIYCIYGVPN